MNSSALFGFLGVIVGALIGLVGVRLQTSSYFRQSKSDREESRLDRQRGRQHSWLVQLQDSISDYQGEIVLIHQHNIRENDADVSKKFGSVPMSDEEFRRRDSKRSTLEILNSRIDDPEIRRVIGNFLEIYDKVVHPKNRANADKAFEDSRLLTDIAVRTIGALIRWFDKDSLPKTQFVSLEGAGTLLPRTTDFVDLPGIMASDYPEFRKVGG